MAYHYHYNLFALNIDGKTFESSKSEKKRLRDRNAMFLEEIKIFSNYYESQQKIRIHHFIDSELLFSWE